MHTFGLAPSLASVKRLLGCLTLLRISAILLALLMSHWLSHCHNQEGTLWIENDTHLTLNPEDYLQLVHFLSSWGGHTWLQSTEYYSLNSPQSKQFNVGYSHEISWWDGAWSNNSLNILKLFSRHIMARLCRMGVCQNMFFIGEILSEKYAPKGKFARLGFGLEYSDCVEVEKISTWMPFVPFVSRGSLLSIIEAEVRCE